MKFEIDQKDLINILRRGGLAALSPEAQKDKSSYSRLFQSVKIECKESIIKIESDNGILSTRDQSNMNACNCECKEEGFAYVPAKHLFDWANKQKSSKLYFNFKKTKNVTLIKSDSDFDDYGGKSSLVIKKNGNLIIKSIDKSNTGSRWEIDCYDFEHLNSDFMDKSKEIVLKVNSEIISEALKKISFASQKKDYQNIFNAISFEKYKDNFYLSASDTHRCCSFLVKEIDYIDERFFTETRKEESKIVNGQNILFPRDVLTKILSILKNETIEISCDLEKNKIYIKAGKFQASLSIFDSKIFNKFPSIAFLVSREYREVCSVDRSFFQNRMDSAFMVNDTTVLFKFIKDKEILEIYSLSDNGHSPNVSSLVAHDLIGDNRFVVGSRHIVEFIKACDSDSISIMAPKDSKSIKLLGKDEKFLEYYSMSMEDEKYKTL